MVLPSENWDSLTLIIEFNDDTFDESNIKDMQELKLTLVEKLRKMNDYIHKIDKKNVKNVEVIKCII
jgi:hypothetical protein